MSEAALDDRTIEQLMLANPHLTDLFALGRDGEVDRYSAYHSRLQRRVEVQVSAAGNEPRNDLPIFAERLHPSLAIGYERAALDDEREYCVVEATNSTLADRLSAGRTLSADEIARIGIQLADCMATMHQLGVVHGPLTTQCIGLTDSGLVMLRTARRTPDHDAFAEDVGSLASLLADLLIGTADRLDDATLAANDDQQDNSDEIEDAIVQALNPLPGIPGPTAASLRDNLRAACNLAPLIDSVPTVAVDDTTDRAEVLDDTVVIEPTIPAAVPEAEPAPKPKPKPEPEPEEKLQPEASEAAPIEITDTIVPAVRVSAEQDIAVVPRQRRTAWPLAAAALSVVVVAIAGFGTFQAQTSKRDAAERADAAESELADVEADLEATARSLVESELRVNELTAGATIDSTTLSSAELVSSTMSGTLEQKECNLPTACSELERFVFTAVVTCNDQQCDLKHNQAADTEPVNRDGNAIVARGAMKNAWFECRDQDSPDQSWVLSLTPTKASFIDGRWAISEAHVVLRFLTRPQQCSGANVQWEADLPVAVS